MQTGDESTPMLVRAFDRFERACFSGSLFCALFLSVFITVDVVSRWAFNRPIPSGFEITEEYLLPLVFCLSVSRVYAMGGHVRVSFLLRYLPAKAKAVIDTVMDALGFLFCLLLTWGAGLATWNAVANGEYSNSFLQYPLAPIFGMIALGFGSLSIRVFISLFHRVPTDDLGAN